MTSFKISFLLVALLVACALAESKNLKCYDCVDCKKVDKDTKTSDCKADEVCYIAGDPDKEKWVRGCAPDKVCDAFKDKKDAKCSTCKEDECNGSVSLTASYSVISVVLAMVLRYAH